MTRRRVSAASQKPRRIYRRVRLPLVKLSKVVIVKRKVKTDTTADSQTASTTQSTPKHAKTQQSSSEARCIAPTNAPVSTDTPQAIDSQHLTSNQYTANTAQKDPSASSSSSEITSTNAHQATSDLNSSTIATHYQQATLTEIASFNPDCNPYMDFISGMPQILAALPNEAFQAPKPDESEKTDKRDKIESTGTETAKGTGIKSTEIDKEAVDSKAANNSTNSHNPTSTNSHNPTSTNSRNPTSTNSHNPTSTNSHNPTSTNSRNPTSINSGSPTSINNPFQMLAQQNAERLRRSTAIRFESPSLRSQPAHNTAPVIAKNDTINKANSTDNIEQHSQTQAETTSQKTTQLKATERKKVIKIDNKKQSSFQQTAHSTKHPFSYLQLPKASIRSCPDSVLRDFNQKTPSTSPDTSTSTTTPSSESSLKATLATDQKTNQTVDKNTLNAGEAINQSTEKFNQIMASLSAAVMTHKSNNQAFNNMMQQRVDTLFQHHERWGSFPWENVPSKLTRKEHFKVNPITSSFIQSNQTINATAHPQFNQHNGDHYSTNDDVVSNTAAPHLPNATPSVKKKLMPAPTALHSQFAHHFTPPNTEQSQLLQFLIALEKMLTRFPVTELTARTTPNSSSKYRHTHNMYCNEYLPEHTTWVCHTHNSASVFEFSAHYVLIHQPNRSYCLPRDIWRSLWLQAMQKDPAIGSPREHIQACRFLLFGRCFSLQTSKTIVRFANQSPLHQHS